MAKRVESTPPLPRPKALPMLAYLSLGPLIWALHLAATYALHTLFCAAGGSPWGTTNLLLAATVLTAAPLAIILALQRSVGRLFGISDSAEERRVYDAISRAAGLLSLAGILWSGAAVVLLSSCVQGR